MVSCIICSCQSELLAKLKDNILSTIGCEYELIVIDNAKNDYTIFSAYNEAVKSAMGDICCFMHEDIYYHTQDWGKYVQSMLSDESIGVGGMIGSQFMPNIPIPWCSCGATQGTLLQGILNRDGNYSRVLEGNEVKDITDVVVVDGFWFCIRTELFRLINFDAKTYNSFHCYDMDICLQILALGKRVVILPNILIEHYSLGNVDAHYYNQLDKFYSKWKSMLPTWRGIVITDSTALWVSNILDDYQRVIHRVRRLENSMAYRIGRYLLGPLKKIKKWKDERF